MVIQDEIVAESGGERREGVDSKGSRHMSTLHKVCFYIFCFFFIVQMIFFYWLCL